MKTVRRGCVEAPEKPPIKNRIDFFQHPAEPIYDMTYVHVAAKQDTLRHLYLINVTSLFHTQYSKVIPWYKTTGREAGIS